MKRRCFYSFHYNPDCHRAAQVRQIGSVEGERPTADNAWETVRRGTDLAIKRWINSQLEGKSCTIVLVGSDTANRKWINYEIVESWNAGIGVVGIHIHGLKNLDGETSAKGNNPFDYIKHGPSQQKLSSFAKCYNPAGTTSKKRYAWICEHLANAVEESLRIRRQHA